MRLKLLKGLILSTSMLSALCPIASAAAVGVGGTIQILDAETHEPVGKAGVFVAWRKVISCGFTFTLFAERCYQDVVEMDLRTDADGYVTIPAWRASGDTDTLIGPEFFVYVPGGVYLRLPAVVSSRDSFRLDGHAGPATSADWYEKHVILLFKRKLSDRDRFDDGNPGDLLIGQGPCDWMKMTNYVAAVQVETERLLLRAQLAHIRNTIEFCGKPHPYHLAQCSGSYDQELKGLEQGHLRYADRFQGKLRPEQCPNGLEVLEERMQYFRPAQ